MQIIWPNNTKQRIDIYGTTKRGWRAMKAWQGILCVCNSGNDVESYVSFGFAKL